MSVRPLRTTMIWMKKICNQDTNTRAVNTPGTPKGCPVQANMIDIMEVVNTVLTKVAPKVAQVVIGIITGTSMTSIERENESIRVQNITTSLPRNRNVRNSFSKSI